MMLAIYIVAMLIVVTSLGIYIGFMKNEGKDERGRAILSMASQISFVFLLIGFVFQILYFQFASPTVEQLQSMIAIWMALVFGSNGIAIVFYQRRM